MTSTEASLPESTPAEAAAQPRVEMVCPDCGGTDVCMEAAVRWDVDLQDWVYTTVYDKSGHCDDCDADVVLVERELPASPELASFTVFVRQADGRGTTHISTHEAASREEAEQLALADTAADWGEGVGDPVVHGVIAGDVEIVSWDNDVWE